MSRDSVDLLLTLFTQFWREPDIIVDRMERTSITVPHSGEVILGMAEKLLELFPYLDTTASQDKYQRCIEKLADFFHIELPELQDRLQRKGIPFIQIDVQEETKNQMIYLLTISAALEIVHQRASNQVNHNIMSAAKDAGVNEEIGFKKLQHLVYMADSTYSFLVNLQILENYASLLGLDGADALFKDIKDQLLMKVVDMVKKA